MSDNAPQTLATVIQRLLRSIPAAFEILRHYPVIIPIAIIMLIDETNYSGINNVALPSYLTNVTSASGRVFIIGALTSTFLFSEMLFRMPCGWLSDRVGRARLIVLAIFLAAPSFFLGAIVRPYTWLFPLRIWDGLMAAVLFTSSYAIIGDAVPERFRANAMGVINAMYMVGLLCGYGIAGSIDRLTNHPRHFLFVSAALALLAGIMAFIFFRQRPELNAPHPEVHREEAEKAVVSVARHLTLLSVTFLQNLALTIIAPFMYLFVVKPEYVPQGGLGLSLGELALLGGAPLLGIAFLAIPLSRMADRIGKLTAVRIAFTIVAATLWIFAATRHVWLLALVAAVIGVAFSMGVPAWLAILSSLTGHKTRGATLGGYGAVQGFAAVLGPLVGSLIWSHFGRLPDVFVASSVLVGIAAVLTWVALPEHRRKQAVPKGSC
jgi:MFS family permease